MSLFRRVASGVPSGDAIPFRHDGVTHLYFLSSPAGTTDYPHRVRTTWQHASSTDLVTWTEHPPAVGPGERGEVDGDGAWTGSVIERDGTWYLFYTGHQVGAPNPQTICLATSTDGVSFTKYPGNPLLLPPAACEPVDWRDPYVLWNEEEGRYWMVIAARLATGPKWRRGCIWLATSDDLLTWQVEDEPFYVPGDTYCPECPELWPLDGRWFLVYSRFSEQAGTIVRVADGPRGPFRVPSQDQVGGRRWYAAKSAPSADGQGRDFWGWIHDRSDEGRWCWGGDFAAPRRVTVTADGSPRVSLPEAVRASFSRAVEGVEGRVRLEAVGGGAERIVAPVVDASPYLADFTFRVSGGAAAAPGMAAAPGAAAVPGVPSSFGVLLRTDAELGGWYLTLDRLRGSVHLARWPHPLDDFWADLVGRGQERREVDGP
ncbi:MAG: family 43 glycosylhydrolase, partial [Chloroflexi bacterium]|nr:family 43 glycosylhydrolase [Chloroflexota bacterium]